MKHLEYGARLILSLAITAGFCFMFWGYGQLMPQQKEVTGYNSGTSQEIEVTKMPEGTSYSTTDNFAN